MASLVRTNTRVFAFIIGISCIVAIHFASFALSFGMRFKNGVGLGVEFGSFWIAKQRPISKINFEYSQDSYSLLSNKWYLLPRFSYGRSQDNFLAWYIHVPVWLVCVVILTLLCIFLFKTKKLLQQLQCDCGYSLVGIQEKVCPECSREIKSKIN